MSSEIPGIRHQGFPENATGNSRLSPSGFLPWNTHVDDGGASFLSLPVPPPPHRVLPDMAGGVVLSKIL